MLHACVGQDPREIADFELPLVWHNVNAVSERVTSIVMKLKTSKDTSDTSVNKLTADVGDLTYSLKNNVLDFTNPSSLKAMLNTTLQTMGTLATRVPSSPAMGAVAWALPASSVT